MIRAYWKSILLLMAVGAGLALLASLFMPKKYEAQLDMRVFQTPPSVPYIPSTQAQSVVDMISASGPRGIVTQVEQLQSLGVLELAAKTVADRHSRSAEVNSPTSELNPENLQRAISISADQSSDIINFRIRMSDPDLAKEVAQEVYLAFVAQNEQNGKKLAQQAITELRSQTKKIDNDLKTIDQQSRDLRAKTGVPDLASYVQVSEQGLSQLKQSRDLAQIESAGAHRTVSILTDELQRTPKMIPLGSATSPNPVRQHLEMDLGTAMSDRAALLARYLPDNDQVKAADERIRGIEAQLKKLKEDVPSQTSMGLNTTYLTLEGQLANAKAAADAADSKARVAEAQVAQKEQELKAFAPIQTQLSSLARQQQALEKVYYGYQDQLKTLEAAQQGRTSPVEEITEPYVFPQAVSPKVGVNGAFGALIGLIFGVLAMLYTEGRRQPIRSLAQLNGLALKPVYRMIPELREPFRGLQKAPPEPFESLLGNFLHSAVRPYRIAVVGMNKDSGASSTALNLAIAAARHGSKVLLVQCDPKGALYKAGTKEELKADQTVDVAPLVKGMAADTVLSSAEHAAGIASAVTSRESDLTVIDLEPATRSAEYAFLAPYVNEVILLVRAGARSVEFLQAQQALRDAGAARVTVVFTRTSDFSVIADTIEIDDEEIATQPVALLPVPTAAHYETETYVQPQGPAAAPPSEPAERQTEEPTVPVVNHNGAGHEEPPKRTRSTPTVSIEDFGGIARAKAPEAPKKAAAASETKREKSPRRRSRVDTSDIDS